MNTATHTPTPYKADGRFIYAPADGAHIAECAGKDDATFIVHAVNAHDELVEALSKIADFTPGNGDVCEIIAKTARAALAKASA